MSLNSFCLKNEQEKNTARDTLGKVNKKGSYQQQQIKKTSVNYLCFLHVFFMLRGDNTICLPIIESGSLLTVNIQKIGLQEQIHF